MKRLIPLASILITNFLNAANPPKVQQLINHKDWSFVENKGQLMDDNHKVITNVKYYSHKGGVHVYCKPGIVSFVFTKIEKDVEDVSEATGTSSEFRLLKGAGGFDAMKLEQSKPAKVYSASMDLVLINSNSNALINATDQQEYYENYYTTGDANHGITNVHTFKTIIYKDVYPNIDMILNAKSGQSMEYSFLVHPGGNVSDILIKWNGADKAKSIKSGGFKFYNALGTMVESEPKSFVGGKMVTSSFMERRGVHVFKVMGYDKRKDLVIDPSLVWATYFGGGDEEGEEGASGVTTDAMGNIYVTGMTGSRTGIATIGAFKTSYEGARTMAFLAKFNNSGKVAWATYFGGSGEDGGSGIVTDVQGSIYITGGTSSNEGLATTGACQTSFGGTNDAFLAKFNNSGGLSWSTYFGGSGNEYGSSLIINTSGEIYVSGETNSTNGIATIGAFQTFLTEGRSAFLAKFNTSGFIIWATYFGDKCSILQRGICTDKFGNIYITGSHSKGEEGKDIITTSGAYQISQGGDWDAFLVKFNSSGKTLWATYFGGSGRDMAHGICTDGEGNILLIGETKSTAGIASSITYKTSLSGRSDVFIAKFNSDGRLIWSTYYGGNNNDYGYGITTDLSGHIYIVGSTQSENGIAYSNAHQNICGGKKDAFFAKFNSSGSLLWATYYGGTGKDEASSVTLDALGNAYIVGITYSNSGIATEEAHQIKYGGGDNRDRGDAFLAKFSF